MNTVGSQFPEIGEHAWAEIAKGVRPAATRSGSGSDRRPCSVVPAEARRPVSWLPGPPPELPLKAAAGGCRTRSARSRRLGSDTWWSMSCSPTRRSSASPRGRSWIRWDGSASPTSPRPTSRSTLAGCKHSSVAIGCRGRPWGASSVPAIPSASRSGHGERPRSSKVHESSEDTGARAHEDARSEDLGVAGAHDLRHHLPSQGGGKSFRPPRRPHRAAPPIGVRAPVTLPAPVPAAGSMPATSWPTSTARMPCTSCST